MHTYTQIKTLIYPTEDLGIKQQTSTCRFGGRGRRERVRHQGESCNLIMLPKAGFELEAHSPCLNDVTE